MRNFLTVLYSVVVCYACLTEAEFINCKDPIGEIPNEQEFKLSRCKNADYVCDTHYTGGTGDRAVFEFTAPDGRVTKESDFGCKMAQYKKKDSDISVSYSCQKGEQKNIDSKYFNAGIKPIEGGETRLIVCYCGPDGDVPQDSTGYIKAELIVYGIVEKCYSGEVNNIYYY